MPRGVRNLLMLDCLSRLFYWCGGGNPIGRQRRCSREGLQIGVHEIPRKCTPKDIGMSWDYISLNLIKKPLIYDKIFASSVDVMGSIWTLI